MKSGLVRGIVGGAVAGVAGGVLFALFWAVVGIATGGSALLVAQMAGFPFFGNAVLEGSASALLVGLLLHLAVSAFWGSLYGVIFQGEPKGLTVMGALAWGFAVWAVMFYGVAPLAGSTQLLESLELGQVIVAHGLYGLSVGLAFLPFQRRDTSPGRIVRRRPAHATV